MKKKCLPVLLIALLIFSLSSTLAESHPNIGDTIKKLESGVFRVSFEKGYRGFCISFPSDEAIIDDVFTVVSLDGLYNANNIKVSSFYNTLKVYATQFPDHFLGNDIVTQHTIWHFSDNFNGWRLDYTLIDDIKNTAATVTIPDHYTQQLTITDPETQQTKQIDRTWDFIILENQEHQAQNRPLFFAYKYTDTPSDLPKTGDEIKPGDIPATGDSAALPLWFGMLAVSAIGMMCLGRRAGKEH